jgi:Leucine-rich repeat (LRR) protein
MRRNRLALSHNYLQTFPARFAECTSLRYLNVRQNRIKEFPLAVSTTWLETEKHRR